LADLTSLLTPGAAVLAAARLGLAAGGGGGLALVRLLGHQHLARRVHHGADGLGLGQGLAALGIVLARQGGFVLGAGRGGGRLGCWLGLGGRGLDGFGLGRLLSAAGAAGAAVGWAAAAACSAARRACSAAAWRLLFALAALFGLLGLAAQQLGLAAGFFFAPRLFGGVDAGRGRLPRRVRPPRRRARALAPGSSSRLMKVRFLRTSTWMVRALPEASACLISLVDFLVSVILRAAPCRGWPAGSSAALLVDSVSTSAASLGDPAACSCSSRRQQGA
jgi:hypothetical protein